MALEAFIDESIDRGRFVMAGYVSTPEAWASFSAEWDELLPLAFPNRRGVREFKMSSMTGSGMDHVPAYYRVIERHAELAISVTFEIAHLQSAIARISIDGARINFINWDNPYIFAFRAMTDYLHMNRDEFAPVLRDAEIIDFIFDERGHEGRVIRDIWDRLVANMPEDVARRYGSKPRFEDSEKFLPLQAADFWAWWVRRWSNELGPDRIVDGKFPWTFDPERPPKAVIWVDEEGIIEYLSNIIQAQLKPGHKIRIAP